MALEPGLRSSATRESSAPYSLRPLRRAAESSPRYNLAAMWSPIDECLLQSSDDGSEAEAAPHSEHGVQASTNSTERKEVIKRKLHAVISSEDNTDSDEYRGEDDIGPRRKFNKGGRSSSSEEDRPRKGKRKQKITARILREPKLSKCEAQRLVDFLGMTTNWEAAARYSLAPRDAGSLAHPRAHGQHLHTLHGRESSEPGKLKAYWTGSLGKAIVELHK